MSDPQWAGGCERGTITSPTLPPIGNGVNHWVVANGGMMGVGEIPDPVDHRRSGQIITGGTMRVIVRQTMGVQLVDLAG